MACTKGFKTMLEKDPELHAVRVHSITFSALINSACGIFSPSALAILHRAAGYAAALVSASSPSK